MWRRSWTFTKPTTESGEGFGFGDTFTNSTVVSGSDFGTLSISAQLKKSFTLEYF